MKIKVFFEEIFSASEEASQFSFGDIDSAKHIQGKIQTYKQILLKSPPEDALSHEIQKQNMQLLIKLR